MNFLILSMMITFFSEVQAAMLWVANYDDDSLSLIENNSVTTIKCGKGPREVVIIPDLRKIFVAECKQNTIGIIDLDTYAYIGSVPCDGEPRGLTYSLTLKRLYGVLKDKDVLFSLNPLTNEYESMISTFSGPRCIALDEIEKRLWVTCNASNKIAIYSLTSWELIHVIECDPNPYAVHIIPEGVVFVSSIGSDIINLYNSKTFEKISRMNCGKHPTSINSDNNGRIFVTNLDEDLIRIFSKETLTPFAVIKTGKKPFSLYIDKDNIFFTNCGEHTVQSVDLNFLKNIKVYNVGLSPHGITGLG